jgi:hypothetical protein
MARRPSAALGHRLSARLYGRSALPRANRSPSSSWTRGAVEKKTASSFCSAPVGYPRLGNETPPPMRTSGGALATPLYWLFCRGSSFGVNVGHTPRPHAAQLNNCIFVHRNEVRHARMEGEKSSSCQSLDFAVADPVAMGFCQGTDEADPVRQWRSRRARRCEGD